VDLAARCADAGEMRGRQQRGLSQDARNRRMRALAGRAARAIGDGDEIGSERRQPVDGFPQALFHLLGLRREELEGDRRPFRRVSIRRGISHGGAKSRGTGLASLGAAKIGQTWWLIQPTIVGKLPNINVIYPLYSEFFQCWAKRYIL